jgi:diguanylate cyclase (GGDEF)-like protein
MDQETSEKNESPQRLSFSPEAGVVGIWDFDAADESLHWNPVMHELFDHPVEKFTSEYCDFLDRLHPDDLDRVTDAVTKAVQGKGRYDINYRVIWRDGTVHHICARAELFLNSKNELKRMTGICYDISSQVHYENKLRNIAIHDALTGLYNRQYIIELETDLQEKHHYYSALFIDLNGFKNINDSLGHTLGDRLLRLIAKKMQHQLRTEDADIIRLGGDEYLVLLYDDHSPQSIDTICKKLLSITNGTFNLKNRNVRVSASIGVASRPEHGESLEDIIKAADLAMYYNKSEKKYGYKCFDSQLKGPRDRLLLIEQHLYSAIERKEIELHYQPIYNSNSIHAIESLIRWNHPTLGSIFPVEFIPIAESNGYIHTIDRWVIDSALQNHQHFCQHSKTIFKISINISINLLTEESVYDYIKERLNNYGIQAKYIILEITETTYTKRFNAALNALTKLHDLGVNIALDDFGIEYSSLKYLQTLPVDYLKIDGHFVANISHPTSAAIIETTVDLAKKLKIQVIAEGVETNEQAQLILKTGCHLLQGNYFEPALNKKALLELLETSFSTT